MSHTPHELSEEFPDNCEAIHSLKMLNAHFSKLADSYHEINRQVHRVETDVEPASDQALEDLKKQRLALKDEISSMIASHLDN